MQSTRRGWTGGGLGLGWRIEEEMGGVMGEGEAEEKETGRMKEAEEPNASKTRAKTQPGDDSGRWRNLGLGGGEGAPSPPLSSVRVWIFTSFSPRVVVEVVAAWVHLQFIDN